MENVQEVSVAVEAETKEPAQGTTKRTFNKEGRPDRRNSRRNNRDNQREDDGLIKKTVDIRRVTKVVKGGRTMRFAALVVVGDGKGQVGVGVGKAAEVPQAIEKATQRAKKQW